MPILSSKIRIATLLAAAFFAGTALAADAPAPAGRWHVVFNGQAASDGEMQFRVTPHEGEAMTVSVKIARGRGELFMARDVCDAFKAQLSRRRFKSEVVADQLLVKAGPGESDFALELVSSTVSGAHVHVTAN